MAHQGFYADNESRAFPFRWDAPLTLDFPGVTTSLPTDTVVDFGALGYVNILGTVHLVSISRSDTEVVFVFESSVFGSAGALSFHVPLSSAEFTQVRASVTAVSGDNVTRVCPIVWEGYLVIGRLSALLALLPNGDQATATTGALAVEPTLCRALGAHEVWSVNLGNYPRTISSPTQPDYVVHPVATAMTGAITLREGYNCAIQHSIRENAIVIGTQVGAGAGVPCGEVSRYPGEVPPTGSTILSGGPSCAEVVHSISGTQGRSIRIVGGAGFTVKADPNDAHAIILTFTG